MSIFCMRISQVSRFGDRWIGSVRVGCLAEVEGSASGLGNEEESEDGGEEDHVARGNISSLNILWNG